MEGRKRIDTVSLIAVSMTQLWGLGESLRQTVNLGDFLEGLFTGGSGKIQLPEAA